MQDNYNSTLLGTNCLFDYKQKIWALVAFLANIDNVLIYEEQYELNASYFFSRTTITMKFTYTIHTPFTKVSILNTVFFLSLH